MYELFRSCFPTLTVSRERIAKLLLNPDIVCLEERAGDTLCGFALVQGASILLLCVAPEHRGHGVGTRLLARCEAHIAAHGGTDVTLGRGGDYLFQGVPTAFGAVPFFEHHGYTADWTSADLTLELSRYTPPAIPPCPPDVRFGWAKDLPKSLLQDVIPRIDANWMPYFLEEDAPIFAAWQGDALAGLLLLDRDMQTPYFPPNVRGSKIGCVGVLPEYRRRGIGLQMVDAATRELITAGCEWAHIGYTHLASWYSRIGYRVCMEFWMGEKVL